MCGIQLAWIAGCNSDEIKQNSASNSESATEVTDSGASQATQSSMTMPTEGGTSNTATDSVSGTDSDSMTATDSTPTGTVTMTATESTTVGVTESNTDTDATASVTNTDGTVSSTDTDGTAGTDSSTAGTDSSTAGTDTGGTDTDTGGTDTDTGGTDTDTGEMCEAPPGADDCELCVAEECNNDYCDCSVGGDCLCVLSCLDAPNTIALTTCLLQDCLLNELDVLKLLAKATQSVEGLLDCTALLNPTKCGTVCSAVKFLGG